MPPSAITAATMSSIPTGEDRRTHVLPTSLGVLTLLATPTATTITLSAIPTGRGIQPCQIEFYLLVQFHLPILVVI